MFEFKLNLTQDRKKMKRTYIRYTRWSWALLAAFLLVFVTGCEEDADDSFPDPTTNNIQGPGVAASAGSARVLQGDMLEVTVNAVSNAAITSVLRDGSSVATFSAGDTKVSFTDQVSIANTGTVELVYQVIDATPDTASVILTVNAETRPAEPTVTVTADPTTVASGGEITFSITAEAEAGLDTVFLDGEAIKVYTEGETSDTFMHMVSAPNVTTETVQDYTVSVSDRFYEFGRSREARSAEAATISVTVEAPEFSVNWLVGAATPGGWAWGPSEAEHTATKAVEVSPGVYEATVYLNNEAFRFFGGDWEDWNAEPKLNYPFFVESGYTIDANFEDALDGDNNFRFIGTPGFYRVTINQSAQTITLEAVDLPDQLYMVGAATPGGWGWGPSEAESEATLAGEVSPGVYRATITFSNEAFRFFGGAWGNWDATPKLNYPYFSDLGYDIDANFEDALDGDNNFSFIGTPGTYIVTVDYNTRRISLVED